MNSDDIIEIRKRLGLNQDDFGKLVGVSKNTIYNWEKGTKIPESKIPILESLKTKKITNTENAIPVNFSEMNVMMVPLVNKFAYAGYLNGFGDNEYIEELPKIPFADDVEHKGDYLCFEVKGDSMDNDSSESYLEGDIILCRNVRQDFWRSKLHINKWDFVIVHKSDGILLKRILSHNIETGELLLHSLNDFYEDRIINIKDVVQILNVVDVKRKIKRR